MQTHVDTQKQLQHVVTISNKIDIIYCFAISMNMRWNTSSLPLFKNLLQYLGARNWSCYATFALGERHPAALRVVGRSRKLLGLDGLRVGNCDLRWFSCYVFILLVVGMEEISRQSFKVVFQPTAKMQTDLDYPWIVPGAKNPFTSKCSTHVCVCNVMICSTVCVCESPSVPKSFLCCFWISSWSIFTSRGQEHRD